MSRKAVSRKDLNFWKVEYEHGDFKRVAVALGVSRTTVSNAFKGTATQEVAKKITFFYKYENIGH